MACVVDLFCPDVSLAAFDESTLELVKEIDKINAALNHRPLHANTPGYQKFRQNLLGKITALQSKYPHLDFTSALP